jgi:hypothetical protein
MDIGRQPCEIAGNPILVKRRAYIAVLNLYRYRFLEGRDVDTITDITYACTTGKCDVVNSASRPLIEDANIFVSITSTVTCELSILRSLISDTIGSSYIDSSHHDGIGRIRFSFAYLLAVERLSYRCRLDDGGIPGALKR